ncbi:hypothetical protein Avbf_05465 [Armadillidium vulgare]|nr:hypothetical protein Avbf_05465 [Armadillidium vulgare]
MAYLKARIYVDNKAASAGLSTGTKVAIGVGATVLSVAGAVLAAPLVLAGVGFTAGGVAAGTMAAAWQAAIGNVVAGSLFASLQSAGVIGLGAVGIGAAGAAGAAFGGIVGGIIANGVKMNIPVLNIQKTFDIYDSDQDGYLSAEFLRNILKDLEVEMSDKELGEKFKKATGCEFNNFTPISYEEFLSIFGLKIYKDKELAGILENLFVKVVIEKGKLVTDDVKGMLEVLNVNASEKHVEACFVGVLGNQTENITLQQFLKIFGVSKTENS